MKYIDLHCDTLTELKEGETLVRNHKNVDLKSLFRQGRIREWTEKKPYRQSMTV